MNGKSKCKILKDIRKKIAEDNDIDFVTSECKYQGECPGTCPKCEAELRYLEEELAKRKNLGKAVAVAGIAAALVVGSTGCDVRIPSQTAGDPTSQTLPYTTELILGEMAIDVITQPFDDELAGDPTYPSDLVMGAIAVPEDSSWPE
jgi:hypothetical protein